MLYRIQKMLVILMGTDFIFADQLLAEWINSNTNTEHTIVTQQACVRLIQQNHALAHVPLLFLLLLLAL